MKPGFSYILKIKDLNYGKSSLNNIELEKASAGSKSKIK